MTIESEQEEHRGQEGVAHILIRRVYRTRDVPKPALIEREQAVPGASKARAVTRQVDKRSEKRKRGEEERVGKLLE
jgi:hypothetical protein